MGGILMNDSDHEAIYQFVDAVSGIETMSELNNKFGKLIYRFGFTKWACVQVSASSFKINEPLRRIFGNFQNSYLNHYMERGHIENDVAAKKVMVNFEPFWWSEIIEEHNLEKAQQIVFEEAKAFGMVHGLAIPLRFPDGSVWSCLLTSDKLDEDPQIRTAMYLAASFYAARGMNIRDKAPIRINEHKLLTSRQRQILEFIRLGHSQERIALILGISISTVNNLMADARERLGCETTPQLVVDAIMRGEITIN